jgi:putative tributyrin esterase
MNAFRHKYLAVFFLFAVAFGISLSIYAQKQQPTLVVFPATVENHKLNSKLMAREMPYQVVLPYHYKRDNLKNLSVVYLLHGLTGHFDNWTSKTKITEYASEYGYIVVMPEGANGWYTDSETVVNDKYESYIVQELIPEIDRKFRTVADRKYRAVGGLSMGGYGAIKFGLKYPELFSLVGSFSGALGAAGWTDAMFARMNMRGAIPDSIKNVYGADDSKTRLENDIFRMTREISAEKIKTLPFIYQSCGTEDFLIQNNREFADLLFQKKIPHEYRALPGAHNWTFWDDQVKEFLEMSEKFMFKK